MGSRALPAPGPKKSQPESKRVKIDYFSTFLTENQLHDVKPLSLREQSGLAEKLAVFKESEAKTGKRHKGCSSSCASGCQGLAQHVLGQPASGLPISAAQGSQEAFAEPAKRSLADLNAKKKRGGERIDIAATLQTHPMRVQAATDF